jgi:hypothetical protein
VKVIERASYGAAVIEPITSRENRSPALNGGFITPQVTGKRPASTAVGVKAMVEPGLGTLGGATDGAASVATGEPASPDAGGVGWSGVGLGSGPGPEGVAGSTLPPQAATVTAKTRRAEIFMVCLLSKRRARHEKTGKTEEMS